MDMEPHKLLVLYAILTALSTSYITSSLSNWNSSQNIENNNTSGSLSNWNSSSQNIENNNESGSLSNWNSSSQNIENNNTRSDTITTILKISSFVTGALVGGQLSDNYSPWIASLTATLFLFCGPITMVLSSDAIIQYTGYFLLETGTSLVRVAAPIYIAETSHPSNRGKTVSLTGDTFQIGFFICYAVQIAITAAQISYPWKIAVGISCVFPLMQFLVTIKLPATPNIQLKKDHDEDLEARRSIFRKIALSFKNPAYRMALLADVSLMVVQQILGVETVLFNEPKIPFKKESDLGLLILLQLMGSLINFFIVDKFPRKKQCYIALSLLAFVLSLLACVFQFNLIHGPLVVIIISAYLFIFSAAFGEISQVVNAEIYPKYFRGSGVALSSISASVSSTFASPALLSLGEKFGAGIMFALCAGGAIIGLIVVHICLPETKGLTLMEIAENFQKNENTNE